MKKSLFLNHIFGIISIFGLMILLSSCAGLPPKKHEVLLTTKNLNKRERPITRSEKYLKCVVKLSREGIKQSLIGTLCDKSYGSITD